MQTMNANVSNFLLLHAVASAHLLLFLMYRKLHFHILPTRIVLQILIYYLFEFFAYSCEGHGSVIARHLIRFLPLTVLSNGMSHDFFLLHCNQVLDAFILQIAIILLNDFNHALFTLISSVVSMTPSNSNWKH